MNVTVNGETHDVAPDATVMGLIRELHLKPELVAAQLNDIILSREEFDETALAESDVLELIRIVGGG